MTPTPTGDGEMMTAPDFERLAKAHAEFERIGQGCWRFIAHIDNDMDVDCSFFAWAGDTNCPHLKHYDPSDGHGLSELRFKEGELWDERTEDCSLARMLEITNQRIAAEWPYAVRP